ncbi:unnamed protein product [Leptidea sinapis]|uniref:ZP domain-containing protein n=1 Tax=Leptidea sinapis TaxID=189913 RepID=A0A5E4QWQ3_9NEOP|nr:unnamed protein product [Leptidea sinapis]
MWSMWCYVFVAAWVSALAQNTESNGDFTPIVTATCKSGVMSIRINFSQPFNGVAHAREHRTSSCMAYENRRAVSAAGRSCSPDPRVGRRQVLRHHMRKSRLQKCQKRNITRVLTIDKFRGP